MLLMLVLGLGPASNAGLGRAGVALPRATLSRAERDGDLAGDPAADGVDEAGSGHVLGWGSE
jgi:hypothetical protein